MSDRLKLPVHVRSVGANSADAARAERLVAVCHPLSYVSVTSLEELGDLPTDGPTVVRLSGRSTTQVLTWLGSKGRVTSDAAILGYADGIIIDAQPPRAIGVLASAFVSAFASSKPHCDTSGAALILGACEETRAIAAALSRLGFKRLLLSDPDDKKTDHLAQIIRKRLFGFSVQSISRATLTQVPNECSIAINLVGEDEESFLEDVSYLNFLRNGESGQKGGIWIDWTGAMTANGHTDEIENAGAQILSSDPIRAWRDALLLDGVPGLLASTGQRPESLALDLMLPPRAPSAPTETDPS